MSHVYPLTTDSLFPTLPLLAVLGKMGLKREQKMRVKRGERDNADPAS